MKIIPGYRYCSLVIKLAVSAGYALLKRESVSSVQTQIVSFARGKADFSEQMTNSQEQWRKR